MGFFNFSKNRDVRLKKHIIKSGKDLGISPSCLVYVEKGYDTAVNEFLSKKHGFISKKICHYNESGKLIYLPNSIDDLFDNQDETLSLLKYYYPNLKIGDDSFDKLHGVINTLVFTNLAFSFLGYDESITPGFLRFVEKRPDEQEYNYIYEYIQLDLSSDVSIKRQVKHCIEQCFAGKPSRSPSHKRKRRRGFYGSFSDESGGSYSSLFGDYEDDDYEVSDDETPKYELYDVFESDRETKEEEALPDKEYDDIASDYKEHADRIPIDDSKMLCDEKTEDEIILYDASDNKTKDGGLSEKAINKPFWTSLFEEEETECKKDVSKPEESELIDRIREDILTAKEMGILDLLIKEVGPALFENEEEIHKPSRLIMDDNFKIFLTDFDNMEIEMTPLPKTLFILFLRHTDGILLKHIHDYKKELLEIYKLLSYKEEYSDIVESIDRICNPTDGSINEKISRIKEAFIKKMSIDTAKYYIVTGERGQKKEIALNRSLLQLPSMFEEIIMTIGISR